MKIRKTVLHSAIIAMQLLASPNLLEAAPKKSDTQAPSDGYTINFDNVPIQEFLKFISKIAGLNVIYDESDLNFNVTIVSEDQTDLNNVLSALVQILRIHGLTLIEEEKNLLIHRNESVKQIPTVVSSESPLKGKIKPAIMTKVFRIQKGNPSHIASLIIPMLSKDALVEVSLETRQLIITDVSSSIDTIEQLLLSLDAPETPYDVDAYTIQNADAETLSTLAKKILAPIADTTTLEIIPQPGTKTIYVVSTPFLIDKALAILQDLDKQEPFSAKNSPKYLNAGNVFVYKLQYKTPEEVEADLKKMSQAAGSRSFYSEGLGDVLANMKYIKSTNSLIFVGEPHDLEIIHSFLKSLDSAKGDTSVANSFLVYNIKNATEEQLSSSLRNLADYLQKQKNLNSSLVAAINSMHWIKSTNSLFFTGNPDALKELSSLLPSFDVAHEKSKASVTQAPFSNDFLIYTPKQTTSADLKNLILEAANNLKSANLSDPTFLKTLESVKELPSSNQLVFTGDRHSLERLQGVLLTLDQKTSAEANAGPYFVPLKNVSLSTIKKALSNLSSDLPQNNPLSQMIAKMDYLPESKVLIFHGPKEAFARIQEVIQLTDNAQNTEPLGSSVAFYPVHNKSVADMISILHETAVKLANSPNPPQTLIQSLKNAQALANSSSIIVSGTADDLSQIKELILTNDVSSVDKTARAKKEVVFIPTLNKTAKEIVAILRETADTLSKTGSTDSDLIQTLKTADATPNGNTVILSGSPLTLTKAQELITSNDTPVQKVAPLKMGKEVVFVPTLHKSAKEIVLVLKETGETLSKSGSTDLDLIQTLKTADSTPNGNTVILSGSPQSIKKAEDLITANDSLPQKIMPQKSGNELIFVPIQNRPASEIASLLRETGATLSKTNNTDPDLIQTLKSASVTPNGNTIILSGHPGSVRKAEELIAANDTLHKSSPHSEVFVYKLRYLTASDLKTTLLGIAEHADLNGPSRDTDAMIKAINSLRIIPDSNAVQFVASPQTILKLKDILLVLDVPENARSQVKQQFGTNFLVYKVKNANPQDLLAHLKQIVKEAPNQDSLIKSVSGAQFSASSNSIVFTGDKVDLDKIQTLLENLDMGQAPPPVISPTRQAETYKIYKPTHVSGGELIKLVQNFEQHLVASGVTNTDLAEVIDHLTYIDRTNTLILTGRESDINQVITLLKEFDNQETASGKGGKMFESGVETIDDTGFLIYKLQHQSGSGIVQALTVISSDLSSQTTQKKNTSLVEAIRSTQWVEPTNSLIATGQPRVLTKLRELIESIDQPLKQVFIEILVVESNNTDDLEFGLSWGSQGKVHNRFSWGGGNWSTGDIATNGNSGSAFPGNLEGITSTNLPNGQDIPPILGGFFGVIGDIIWHKGKSYASLGSLVRAFRNIGTVTEVLSQKIVAQDNQNAKVFSGQNIPFTGSLVTTSGLSQTTNANLEYRNVGVTLSITPIIGDNDIITMDIDYELSEDANQGTGGINSNNSQTNTVNGITTTKTSMQTKVHLPDRHFLVLSGTMQNSTVRTNNGIPCLGGLPLVGAAFSLNNKVTTTQNVLIFVKPHIIKSEQIYGKITKEQEEIFGNRNQANVEDFQNGLELIRSADDIEYEEND